MAWPKDSLGLHLFLILEIPSIVDADRQFVQPMTAQVWTVMCVLLVAFEGWAIVDRKPNNTWSAWVWQRLRAYLAGRLVLYPLWTWLTWHWLFETGGGIGRDDAAAVGIGVILALVATTRRKGDVR